MAKNQNKKIDFIPIIFYESMSSNTCCICHLNLKKDTYCYNIFQFCVPQLETIKFPCCQGYYHQKCLFKYSLTKRTENEQNVKCPHCQIFLPNFNKIQKQPSRNKLALLLILSICLSISYFIAFPLWNIIQKKDLELCYQLTNNCFNQLNIRYRVLALSFINPISMTLMIIYALFIANGGKVFPDNNSLWIVICYLSFGHFFMLLYMLSYYEIYNPFQFETLNDLKKITIWWILYHEVLAYIPIILGICVGINNCKEWFLTCVSKCCLKK